MEPHAHLSAEEKKALFTSVTITHRQLEAVHDRIRRAIRQPAGFSFVLVHGPTGVGKTRMMESLAELGISCSHKALLPLLFRSLLTDCHHLPCRF